MVNLIHKAHLQDHKQVQAMGRFSLPYRVSDASTVGLSIASESYLASAREGAIRSANAISVRAAWKRPYFASIEKSRVCKNRNGWYALIGRWM